MRRARARRYGGIDVLVNAADDPIVDAPLLELTEEHMLASWRTGLMGTLRFTQSCVPHMLKRGDGAIVNVASGAGLLAPPGMGAYSAAQEAIRCSPARRPSSWDRWGSE